MSDSVRPRRQQPTRLPRPWDSPGKNTAVGCHGLLQCMKVKREREVAQSCLTLPDPMDCSLPGSSAHGIFQARGLEWVAIAFSAPYLYITTNQQNKNENCSFYFKTYLHIAKTYLFQLYFKEVRFLNSRVTNRKNSMFISRDTRNTKPFASQMESLSLQCWPCKNTQYLTFKKTWIAKQIQKEGIKNKCALYYTMK